MLRSCIKKLVSFFGGSKFYYNTRYSFTYTTFFMSF